MISTFKYLLFIVAIVFSVPAMGDAGEQGISTPELMRQAGLVAVILAIVGLIAIEFFYKKRIERSSYKWLLFLGLLMFPLFAMLSAMTTVMEETKTVASCASCHVMDPFVHDMQNPESASLASRHFKNKWIAENQCYHCHTSYGIHGTLEGKRDGFRHWLLYVTTTYKEPMTFKGSYPNSNCLTCHGGTPKFVKVDSHKSLRNKLVANETSCTTCHGPVHPTPLERQEITPQQEQALNPETEAVAYYLKNITRQKDELPNSELTTIRPSYQDPINPISNEKNR